MRLLYSSLDKELLTLFPKKQHSEQSIFMANEKLNYNLDDVAESFNFQLKGHVYAFRYLTLEEADSFREVADDNDKARDFLYQFITPVSDGAPALDDTFKKMNVKQLKLFLDMVKAELSL
jgi:hypothetical protein